MKSRLVLSRALVFLVLASGVALAASSSQGDDLATAPRTSQQEFKKALAAGTILVLDTRDRSSYASGHIPGALSVPLDELPTHVSRLKRQAKPIVAYCA
jgi:predicted sulfurtransferase